MRKARVKEFKLCFMGMIVSFIAFIVCFGCISGNAYANGGLIGGGGSGGGGSGYSTGGGGGCNDTIPTVDCLGTSWIFYKSTGNVAGLNVQPHIDSAAWIPEECSKHSDQGGGFWHFGRNSYGLSWNGVNYFGDFNNLNDYNTGSGKRGHQDSYNWGATYGSGHYRDRYRTFGNGSLKHELKRGGKVIYKATKYGGDPRNGGQVLEDYKKACIYAGNAPQNCQSIGGGVSWFCYWEDMGGHTLTAYAVTESGTYLNNGNAIGSARVNNGESASVSSIEITGYSFKGWRTNKDTGTPSGSNTYTVNSLTSNTTVYAVYERQKRTLTGKAVNGSGASLSDLIGDVSNIVWYGDSAKITRGTHAAYTFIGWKETATASSYASSNTTFTASSLTSNMTRYAVYNVKSYTLSIDKDVYSVASVKRTKSPYKGATTRSLGNDATIYYGDELEVVLGTNDTTCHPTSKGSYKIDGTAKSAGTYKVTVSNNVSVYARTNILTYTLSVDRAAYSGIKVNRTATGWGSGGSKGIIYEQKAADGSKHETYSTTIYCGDTLSVNFSLIDPVGYSWGSHRFVGKNKDDSSNLSISGHVVGANVSAKTENIIRNHFKARARIFDSVGTSGSNSMSTDFVDSNSTKTLEVNCANSGCTVSFDLALKRIAGTGKTQFVAKRSKGSDVSEKTTSPASPTMPSDGTNGTTLKIDNSSYYTETMKPGEDAYCYYVDFHPYGALSNDAIRTAKACSKAKVTGFKGKSSVSPGSILNPTSTTSTDWTDTSKTTKVRTINKKCDAYSGCNVTFSHRLKADPNNGGSTTYTIERTSNLTRSGIRQSITTQKGSNALVKGLTFSGSDKEVYSETLTLYPGMEVCEKLIFKPNNNQINVPSDVYSEICVSVEGNGQPDDPSNPDRPSNPNDNNDDDLKENKAAFINIKVRNTNYSKYNNYQREVYAMPLQNLQYRAVYNPMLQYTYYLESKKLKIDDKNIVSVSNNSALGTLFNNEIKKSGYSYNKPWNNAFTVYSSNKAGGNVFGPALHKYALGNASLRNEVNSRRVAVGDVGINSVNLNEIAVTNNAGDAQTTPSQVHFGWDDTTSKTMVSNVFTTPMKSIAYVRVPYNYTIVPEVTTPDDTPIPAGEEIPITYDIHVNPRPNPETSDHPNEDSYATVVEEAISKLIVYYPDMPNAQGKIGTDGYGGNKDANLCGYFGFGYDDVRCGYIVAEYKGDNRLNGGGDLNGTTKPVLAKFYARDLKAGSSVCVAAATYPSNSGGYKNWNDVEGSHQWSISNSVCYHIAKKPNIEVWGGNTYSGIGIQTSVANKNNLDGYTNYSISQKNELGTYVFGSFGELAVISRGNVEGFASAAGTGFRANNIAGDSRGLWPGTHPNGPNGNNVVGRPAGNPGGSFEKPTNYCNRVRLSFSNANCGGSIDDGNAGIGDGTNTESNKRDKMSVISKLMGGGEITIEGDSVMVEDGMKDYAYSGTADLIVNGGMISGGVKAIHSEGVVTITGDISYSVAGGAGGYSTLYSVPKIVIYGKKEIRIACNVSRIDALLISDGEVTTCYDASDNDEIEKHINDPENSNQLVINGAVIAENLVANRTYGAATGANSMIPAEIINFDPTLYLWGGADVETGNNDADLDMTYIQELSPRY